MTAAGIFLRGLLMGAADVVPGVSGGTVAFITGIYDRLLASIRAFDLVCLRLLLQRRVAAAWQHVDGGFLLALVLGIATSLLSLARLITYLLKQHPVPLWAFFFGLILASALILLGQVGRWTLRRGLCLATGAALVLGIGLSPVVQLGEGAPAVFLAGFLAICAMILPGISGSFILVLLGMYATVLGAVQAFDLGTMAIFAVGAGCGLLCFSRVLHFLLQHFHSATMALLTGLLFGSLVVVWPWKRALDWVVGSHGELKPAHQLPVWPGDFLAVSGQDPALPLCLALMVAGFALVWLIDTRWGAARVRG